MLKRTNLSQATVFGVFAPSVNFNSEMLLYGLNGRSGQGVWLSTDKIYPSIQSGKESFNYGESEGMDLMYSSGDEETNVNKFREKSMRIAAYYRSIPPQTGIWGERDRAVFSFGYYRSSNANNTSTFNIPLSANRQFTGYIPEFIAYNRLLNPLEKSRVDSYLAIKYGLSLPVSYIGSNEQLLWDYAENTDFNNRVTAIYRDNASGLYQMESSTSYEEGPEYSDLYDYYYMGNPNNRTSASRLLVIGRQYGNGMSDGSYAFWGDNNASTELKEIEGVLGMKIIDRTWLLKTNIQNAPANERVLNWEVQDLNFNTSSSPYVTAVSKDISSNAPTTGYAYTKTPLKEADGYIGINYGSLFGDIYLKFGGQGFSTAGGYDYGYYIAPDYKVYTVVKGVQSGTSFTTLVLTNRLELEKQGDRVFLRVDGRRLNDSEITINEQDMNNPWYASIAITKGILPVNINLRHGGFTDTGNRVELSYGKAKGFSNNTLTWKR